MWQVYSCMAVVVIIVAVLWANGIDYMHKNHPDYKGDDFLGGFDFDDETHETDPYDLNDKTDYKEIGKKDFIKGKKQNENTYSIKSPAGIEWDKGWDEAHSEDILVKKH